MLDCSTMIGWRQSRPNAQYGLPRDHAEQVFRLEKIAWLAVTLFVGTFMLIDFGIMQLVDGPAVRLTLRWLLIGGTCAALTFGLSRRTVSIFVQSMRSERAARNEAEAMADLVATVAAGHSIQDTLHLVVGAVPRLFGEHVRCAIALPQVDGTLRFVASNAVKGVPQPLKGFAFRPGEGFTGRAFNEGRLIRVDDAQSNSDDRPDVGRALGTRALMVAPLIADQRTLGIISTWSLTPSVFREHDEHVLTAVARHAAVALLSAEARDAAYREAANKSAIIDRLGESEERYRRLVELCPDPITVHCDNSIVYANRAALEMAGVEQASDFIGKPIVDFIHSDSQRTVLERARRVIERGESNGPAELTLKRMDGELVQVEATTMPITFEGRAAIQAVMRDITVRKRAEAALAHQAMHDALTGLPNRVLLLDRLEQAIAISKRDGTTLSLLLMDLDRFKEVNDTLGHHAGDLLLQQVGLRLRGALRQADTIARLGGDEFAVILPNTDATGVITVVENLRRRLQAPYSVENQPVVVGASIGVAHSPEHGDEANTLMRRADVAMYFAKRNSVGFATYHVEQDRHSPDRLSMIGELQRAVEEGELVLHYQPKRDLRTHQLVGVEALVRWEHPLRGLLSPDQFIPVAEQAGLIDQLSRWVLRAALVQVNAWRRIGLEIPVAVNLSMRSFRDEQLPDKIRELLNVDETPAHLLMLEITESTLMVDPPRTLTILNRLRAMGIRVAIDDFGTGHSSLAYLKRLPVDEIKIDRTFIEDIATDETDRVIVRCTVDLGHSLGLRVVAEGVEDAVTYALLAELGCDEAQGFYVSPALRGRDLTSWLSAQPLAA